MTAAALDAAKILEAEGVECRVLDMHTVKPLDVDAITKAAKDTGAIVVTEEHLAHGGLCSAVSQAVVQTKPVPMEFVNVGDQYAESGDPDGLLVKYGLTAENVAEAVRKVIKRK
jgi:transketolase